LGLVRWFIEAAAGSLKARKASIERFLSGRQPLNSRLKFDMAVVIWVWECTVAKVHRLNI